MQPPIERIDVSTEELEGLLEQARPWLSEDGYQKLQAAIRTLGYLTGLLEKQETTLASLRELLCPASTEKTEAVLKQAGIETADKKRKAPKEPAGKSAPASGHGRYGAAAYRGAQKVQVPHEFLKAGDPCPDTECGGKVYAQRDPGVLVRGDRRRSRRRCMSWKSCAVISAARSSPPPLRKARARRNTTSRQPP